MANRIVGVDTSVPVTGALIASATAALGVTPAFWGRYFTSTEETGTVEYRHVTEDPVLAPANIRVLPIARQTNKVGGTLAQGVADGQANAADLLATFGEDYLASQGGQFLVFLDVEGPGPTGQPSLSSDYYRGWTQGLGGASAKVTFLPCIYARPDDQATWRGLKAAMAADAPCSGLWLAFWLETVQEPVAWDAPALKPTPDPGVPVLLWQYVGANSFDRDLANPDLDPANGLLPLLVLPPGSAADVAVAFA
jgi:hypothetical protein